MVGTEGTTSGSSDAINSIAFVNGNCADAYSGGKFTSINGTTVQNVAEIDTTTGNVVAGFGTKASASVQTMVGAGNHLLIGGDFTGLNGTLGLVEGDFTSVGGLPRQQIFMLNVGGSSATVTGWTSAEWDGSDPAQPYQCVGIEPFYIQAAAWSPDDSTVYIGTTGYHANGYPTGQTPRQRLCDAAAAFPATQTSVTHEWVNYTGCDSLYSAAADANGAYFGGHERFSMNSNDCERPGRRRVQRPRHGGPRPGQRQLVRQSQWKCGLLQPGPGPGR